MFTGDFRIVDATVEELVASQYPQCGGKNRFENVRIGFDLPFGIF
jgi:hypothetical protein